VHIEVPVELPRGMGYSGAATEDFSLWGMSQKTGWETSLLWLVAVAVACLVGLLRYVSRGAGADSG
jgi:hypothetical protein